MLTAHGDARRVDLRVAGVGEVRALAVCPPRGGDIAAHRIGGEEEDVAVAAGGENDDVGEVGLDLTGDHVARDDAAGDTVDDDDLEHLVAAVLGHRALGHLALHRLVGADEQLLAGLARGVEGAGHLDTTEGPVVEETAVLPGEGDALRHALVDDIGADLGQAVDVGLPAAVVAALHRVVEEPVGGVTVVVVVLRGVDPALRGDGVRAAGAVLVEEALDVVSRLSHGRGGRGPGEPGADDDDVELAPVGRVDQRAVELVLRPHLVDGHVGRTGVGDGLPLGEVLPERVVVERVSHVSVLLVRRGRRTARAAG